MRFFTKKIFLYITAIATVFISTLLILQEYHICRRGTLCREVADVAEPVISLLLTMVALLPLAIIFLFVSDHTFESWKKFAIVGVPTVLVLTYFITRPTGGSNFFTMDWSLYFLAFIYGIFFLLSLLVIIVSWWRSGGR